MKLQFHYLAILPLATSAALGASFTYDLDQVNGRSAFGSVIGVPFAFRDDDANSSGFGGEPAANVGTANVPMGTYDGAAFAERSTTQNGGLRYNVFDGITPTSYTGIVPTNIKSLITGAGFTNANTAYAGTSASNQLLGSSGASQVTTTAGALTTSTDVEYFSSFAIETDVNQATTGHTPWGYDSHYTNNPSPSFGSGRETTVIQFDQAMAYFGANFLDYESGEYTWNAISGSWTLTSGVLAEVRTYRNGTLVSSFGLDYSANLPPGSVDGETFYAGDGDVAFVGVFAESVAEIFDTILFVVGGDTLSSTRDNRWAFGDAVMGAQSTAAPEPTSLLLSSLGGLLIARRRRR